MTAPTVSFEHDPFSAPVRFLAALLAHVVIKPLFWLIDRLGYGERLWSKIGEKMRENVLAGNDFGDYQPSEHDVVICTYPKCGTNWAMQIAHQIAMRGDGEFASIHDVIPWPDWARQEMVVTLDDEAPLEASPTGLRVIKTHLEWDRVPYSPEARYICIIRDPKDAFVSSYHFVRDVIFGPLMPSVRNWLQIYCSRFFPSIWSEHLDGYWQDRDKPNLMILTFEEMKADLEGAVRRFADVMDVRLNDKEFARVCEKSSFAYMKGVEAKFRPAALTPFSARNRKMMRRGASGGSSELLTGEQQAMIDDFFRDDLQKRGSDFPYDQTLGAPELLQ
jgi:hypothetical protein